VVSTTFEHSELLNKGGDETRAIAALRRRSLPAGVAN
jgi:hypothetical protein